MPTLPVELPAVATTPALRDVATAGGPAHSWIRTMDAFTTGDGGGGIWWWDAAATADDDSGTILRPHDVAGGSAGRWRRDVDDMLDIVWFGAVGDNGTDCTTALQAAFNAARTVSGGAKDILRVHVPVGRFVFRQTLVLPSTIHLIGVAPELSVLRASGLPAGADGLRAWFEAANSTAMHITNLNIAGQAGAGGALLAIKGGARMQIRNLSFNHSGTADGGAGLRLVDCQDCEFSNVVMTQIGRPDQHPRLGAAVSIYHEGFSSSGFEGVRPNNLYFYGLRIEDPRATGVYVQDGRGIQLFSGKIDGSFGSVVPEGVPAMHLRDTTNLRWRDGFIAGMKGPTLHVEGYTSAEIIDPIWAPGSGAAMITGAAEFGSPSALGYLPGHVIVPGVTISGGSLNQQMPTNATATFDAICDVTLKTPIRYDDLEVTSRAYNAANNYTAVYCTVLASFPTGNNVAQGLFLVDKMSGRRWRVQDDFLSGGGRQFRIWGNVTGQVAVGAALRVEWDVFPSFRLALRDTALLRPQEARNEAEVPRLFTRMASNLALSGPAFDGAGYVTMVSTGTAMIAGQHSGRVLIDTSTREAWYIAGNDAAGVLTLWYDLTGDLAAAIAGHRFDVATGIDRTIRLIGDRALWQSADRLRQGFFPVTDWKTGGTAIG